MRWALLDEFSRPWLDPSNQESRWLEGYRREPPNLMFARSNPGWYLWLKLQWQHESSLRKVQNLILINSNKLLLCHFLWLLTRRARLENSVQKWVHQRKKNQFTRRVTDTIMIIWKFHDNVVTLQLSEWVQGAVKRRYVPRSHTELLIQFQHLYFSRKAL